MSSLTYELTQEQYNKCKAMDYKTLNKNIKNDLPIAITCGYGYYGHKLVEKNEKYYLQLTIGSTCD